MGTLSRISKAPDVETSKNAEDKDVINTIMKGNEMVVVLSS